MTHDRTARLPREVTHDVPFYRRGDRGNRRVVPDRSPGGLSVWRAIQYSPGFASLAEALARHVSSEAGKAMQTPFSLGEVDELRTLVVAAGFRDVTIRPAVKSLRFPSPEDFVRCYVAGSALAGLVAQVSPDIPEALLADVRQELHNHVDDEGVAFPIEAHVVAARRPGSRAK